MDQQMNRKAGTFLREKKRRKVWQKAVGAMAAIVVFCTTYALILPAITLSGQLVCGMDEHTHTGECYTEEQVLICEIPEGEEHSHTEECYSAVTELTCNITEHTHIETCYSSGDTEGSGGETIIAEQGTDESNEISAYAENSRELTLYPGQLYTENVYAGKADTTGADENVADISWQTGDQKISLGMDAEFTGEKAEISGALYTFTGDNTAGYTVRGTTKEGAAVYLCPRRGRAGFPSTTDPDGRIFFEANDDETFYIKAQTYGGYLYFWRNGDNRFDQQGGKDDNTKFLIYRRAVDDEESSENIPGYVKVVSAGEIEDNGQYLIVAEAGGAYYVLYPSNSTSDVYAHVAKVVPGTLTIEAKQVGTANVTAGDTVFSVTVTDEIHLHRGSQTQIQLPAGAAAEAEPDSKVNVEIDDNGLATVAGIAKGDANVTITVNGNTYTWKIIVEDPLDGKAFGIYNETTGKAMGNTAIGGEVEGTTALQSQDASLSASGSNTYIRGEDLTSWLFEAVSDGSGYYISTMVEGEKKYLTLKTIDGQNYGSLTLEEDPQEIQVQFQEDGKALLFFEDIYVNSSGSSDGRFWGYKGSGDNSSHYLYPVKQRYEVETGTVNHAGTTIHLFDYWVHTQAPDGTDNIGLGINAGHGLEFKSVNGNSHGNKENFAANTWTGNAAPCQGIVNKQLSNGYPTLSGDRGLGDYTGESLAYLFDPDIPVMVGESCYKESHANVKGLLQIDNEGYYYYDCQKNYAEYDRDTSSFTLYDVPAVLGNTTQKTGQFFPFNPISDVYELNLNSTSTKLNHYFGMTMFTRFIQQYEGHTNEKKGVDTVFRFSGDDDVWIFIDGVLVADLGGIHNATSVDINFATGDVIINGGTDLEEKITLRRAFEVALGAEKLNENEWRGDTFADDTTHTLDFFYLERGNNESNLKLSFNLAEIPVTSIFKVNQYGDPVAGARFAVYAADENWNYLDAEGNSYGSKEIDSDSIDKETGEIIGSDGSTVLTPKYVGETNRNGEMVFVKQNNMPYSIRELKTEFGERFILREIDVPPGYRLVNTEIYLNINEKILQCENMYSSGVWASPTLLVTATNELYLAKYSGSEIIYEKQTYVSSKENRPRGTLFAVPFKFNGSGAEELADEKKWSPVYGKDLGGYSVVDAAEHGNSLVQAAIYAAQQQHALGDNVVFYVSPSGSMQAELTSLPGDIATYYYMLGEDEKGKTQYTVAYYWTSADSLDGANAKNTWRVMGDEIEGYSYDGFTRTFGSTIQVPNLNNRMYAQKLNEDGLRVNGAAFAMYRVEETEEGISYLADGDGTKILLTKDSEGNNAANVGGQEGAYSIDEDSGVITVTLADGSQTYTISPAQNASGNALRGITAIESSSKEGGTCAFDNLLEGNYYLREIKAPEDYKMNDTEVMVRVTANAIYANAGTADDGVTVARGPGYVVSTLHQFASDGQIDKTLTWIYGMLRVNTKDGGTFAFDLGEENWPYAANADGEETSVDKENAIRTYLKYAPQDGKDVLFNYTLNTDRKKEFPDQNYELAADTRRLYTDVGWSYLAIYQDSEYKAEAENAGANYELLNEDISNLFSRSVFVQMTDQYKVTDLTIRKVNESDQPLGGAEFRLYRTMNEVTAYYRYSDQDDEKTTEWVNESELNTEEDWKSVTLTTDSDGRIHLKEIPAGTYYLEESKAPAGYVPIDSPIVFRVTGGTIQEGLPNGITIADNGLTLVIPNTRSTISVTAEKKWEGTPGTGQEITLKLYRKIGDGTAELIDTRTLNGSGAGSDTGSSTDSDTGSGTDSDTGSSTDSGTGSGTDSSTDSGTGSGTDTGGWSDAVIAGAVCRIEGWIVTWENLPAYEPVDGTMTECRWYIQEESVNGFRTSYSETTEILTINGSDSGILAAEATGDHGIKKVTVTNTADYVLPASGGSGTSRYLVTGIMLMLAACLCGAYMERRSRRGGVGKL